ncbi:MAG: RBBP9/YdeN family alpha/beta hydrolase [Candidatus Komeilibacteria bacterium]
MTKVFIIHGTGGNPNGNWFPWLKSELEKIGCEVIVPKFPTPEGQSLDAWNGEFRKYINKIDKNTIVVGHSMGVGFLLSVLEQINVKVKGAFFVSGFLELLGNDFFDNLNKTFVQKEFNWDKIQGACDKFYLYHGSNDPYVPVKYAQDVANKLGVKLNIIDNGGHLNTESGYTEFPTLLNDIKKTI